MNHASHEWQWQELTREHIAAVVALIDAVERADHSPIRTTRQEVESYFGEEKPWKAQGAWADGALVAFGFVRLSEGLIPPEITISGGVMPQWRRQGIGAQLLERQLELAAHLANEHELQVYTLVMFVEAMQTDLKMLAHELGFVEDTQFKQMRRPVSAVEIPAEPQGFVRIEPLQLEHVGAVKRMHQLLREVDPSASEVADEAWQHYFDSLERSWCQVAVDYFGDRPELVGYVLVSRFMATYGDVPVPEGYLEEIVVLPAWQGKNVEKALLTEAMQAIALDGVHYAGLDIVQPLHAAPHALLPLVYELGFEQVAESQIVKLTRP